MRPCLQDTAIERNFSNGKIPDENIRRIVAAGLKAPSGCNCQSTSFVIVTEDSLREKIAEILPSKVTRTAPVIHSNPYRRNRYPHRADL